MVNLLLKYAKENNILELNEKNNYNFYPLLRAVYCNKFDYSYKEDHLILNSK